MIIYNILPEGGRKSCQTKHLAADDQEYCF